MDLARQFSQDGLESVSAHPGSCNLVKVRLNFLKPICDVADAAVLLGHRRRRGVSRSMVWCADGQVVVAFHGAAAAADRLLCVLLRAAAADDDTRRRGLFFAPSK